MNDANFFIFRCSSSRRKSCVYIFKVLQGEDEWNSKWKKDTEGENAEKITYSVKYIIMKISV